MSPRHSAGPAIQGVCGGSSGEALGRWWFSSVTVALGGRTPMAAEAKQVVEPDPAALVRSY